MRKWIASLSELPMGLYMMQNEKQLICFLSEDCIKRRRNEVILSQLKSRRVARHLHCPLLRGSYVLHFPPHRFLVLINDPAPPWDKMAGAINAPPLSPAAPFHSPRLAEKLWLTVTLQHTLHTDNSLWNQRKVNSKMQLLSTETAPPLSIS